MYYVQYRNFSEFVLTVPGAGSANLRQNPVQIRIRRSHVCMKWKGGDVAGKIIALGPQAANNSMPNGGKGRYLLLLTTMNSTVKRNILQMRKQEL